MRQSQVQFILIRNKYSYFPNYTRMNEYSIYCIMFLLFDHTLFICITLTVFIVIQSCSVDPIPEKDVISKFDGKNVLESIVRYVNTC